MMHFLSGLLIGCALGVVAATQGIRAGLWQRLHSRIKGWRTMAWGGAVTAAAPLIETLDTLKTVDWSQFLTPRNVALAAAGIGIVTLWLRWVTTGPVGEKC
jgi:hypothetical protein